MPLQSPFNFTVEEHDPAERQPFIVHAGANDVGVAELRSLRSRGSFRAGRSCYAMALACWSKPGPEAST
jgi:hypothetical protein